MLRGIERAFLAARQFVRQMRLRPTKKKQAYSVPVYVDTLFLSRYAATHLMDIDHLIVPKIGGLGVPAMMKAEPEDVEKATEVRS